MKIHIPLRSMKNFIAKSPYLYQRLNIRIYYIKKLLIYVSFVKLFFSILKIVSKYNINFSRWQSINAADNIILNFTVMSNISLFLYVST